jgi:hypothetical protein
MPATPVISAAVGSAVHPVDPPSAVVSAAVAVAAAAVVADAADPADQHPPAKPDDQRSESLDVWIVSPSALPCPPT